MGVGCVCVRGEGKDVTNISIMFSCEESVDPLARASQLSRLVCMRWRCGCVCMGGGGVYGGV